MSRSTDERSVLRPTVFGIAVAAVVVVSMVVSPAVADPSVTGLVWGGLVGSLVLGVVWPLFAVRWLGVRVLDVPTDLVAGQLASIQLELSGRASGLSVSCTGSGAVVVDVVSPGVIRIPLTVGQRGAYRQVRVDIGSDAPFGVASARRSRVLDLPRPMVVAPASIDSEASPQPIVGDENEPVPHGRAAGSDSVRSVRPYTTGDPAHLVHWPSTARLGSLVVRELEPLATSGVAIVVDMGTASVDPGGLELDDDAVDTIAGRAAGACELALDLGARVMLCTAEPLGPVRAEVDGLLDARRRLAVASRGTPGAPPDGWPVVVVGSGSQTRASNP